VRVDESIVVAAPRERVWELVSEPERYSEFMVGSTWEPVEGEPTSGKRARFWVDVEVGSIDLGGTVEVVEFDPPHELAWTDVSGIDNRGRWILRERDGGTEVTVRISYQAPGGILALLAGWLGIPILRGDVRRSLKALAELLERGDG
jgi:uncharacterized membrane protein